MKELIFLVIVFMSLVGCTQSPAPDNNAAQSPSNHHIVSPGNRHTWVVPVIMDDGTKCFVLVANYPSNAISCLSKD